MYIWSRRRWGICEPSQDAWNLVKATAMSMSEALKKAWAMAKDSRCVLTVREWIIDKAQREARAYNMFIDFERNENGMRNVVDGCIKAYAEEVLAETEKALKVRLQTGDVVGNTNGWTMWIPKSQMM